MAEIVIFKGKPRKRLTVERMDASNRWCAVIRYRKEGGAFENEVRTFEEFDELQNIVEAGPNFYCIESIVIKLADDNLPDYRPTLEQAEREGAI